MSTFVHTGYDTQGFRVYHPASQATPLPKAPAKQSSYTSIFSRFFVMQDGVISFSLKGLTLVIGVSISIALLLMLVVSCTSGKVECSTHSFPMISYVIVINEMYDRIFLLLTTVLMFGVNQVNIRAFYRKLYGIIPDGKNATLLYWGLASSLSLPMIGVFDEHNWKLPHGFFAIVFFLSFGVYAVRLSGYLYSNRDKFPQSEQKSIESMKKASRNLMLLLGGLLVSIIFFHSNVPTPMLEWATGIYYINFFAIASATNEYYDSVHDYDVQLKKKEIV